MRVATAQVAFFSSSFYSLVVPGRVEIEIAQATIPPKITARGKSWLSRVVPLVLDLVYSTCISHTYLYIPVPGWLRDGMI